MTEEFDIEHNTEQMNMGTHSRVSFGRGTMLSTRSPPYMGSPGYGRGIPTNTHECGADLFDGHNVQSPHTSSPIDSQPSETDATLKHLSVLITELGKHTGDSVTATLLSDKNCQIKTL
ncbi:hypothetical protein ATANTOWER_005706 [Ataeniobius toweri]|uniref:Uncharacterized protein n=1 Tax=Ataeniobius toweri TaxID=208326 RepID=A0ABU7C8X9_9TELE|nr:hypothetical protein [Ataeniobius toweri]